MKDETIDEWLEGQAHLLGDPAWLKSAWQNAKSVPKGYDPVWLYFDGEVHLCMWNPDLLTGYRWESCEGLGAFSEKAIQAWKPVLQPDPPTADQLKAFLEQPDRP